jgi:EF hand
MRLIKRVPAVFCIVTLICGPAFAAEQGRGRGQAKHAQADHPQKNKHNNKNQNEADDLTRFEGLDQNRDGVITRAEWRGNDQSFRVHDWNRDGVLSGDEVRSGAPRPDWVNRYASWDANRDRVLSWGEWRGSRDQFLRLDVNRDGVLTPAELGIR